MPDHEDARWRLALARISGEIDQRDELLAAGQVRALRAPTIDVPDDLGPAPAELVPVIHELLERLARQQDAVERELLAVGREIARYATARRAPAPLSVEHAAATAFEARA